MRSILVYNRLLIGFLFAKDNHLFSYMSGPDINFCGDLPSRASEIQLSLAQLQLSPALEKIVCFIMFHLKPSKTWCWHVKACFLGQAWMTYLKARYSFHLPLSYNLQNLLAWGNGASTNVEPCMCYHMGQHL